MPSRDTLRGPGQTFYVQIFDDGSLRGELQVNKPSVLVNASVGVASGRVLDVVVSYIRIKCIRGKLWNKP